MLRKVILGLAAAMLLVATANAQDLESSFKNLKEAEAKKDVDLVKKFAGETVRAARVIVASPEPSEAEEKENWKARVEFARQADTYADYTLYAFVLQPLEPAKVAELCETLEGQDGKSQYLPQVAARCLVSMSQAAPAKVLPFAERASQRDPSNEDVWLVLADGYQRSKQNDKALRAATRLVDVVNAKYKDEGAGKTKRDAMRARGYWIIGVIQGDRNQQDGANAALRIALPLIKDQAMRAAALFYLGVANYQIGKLMLSRPQMIEGQKFSEQCAIIPGPYQALAQKNAYSIRTELEQSAPVRRRK